MCCCLLSQAYPLSRADIEDKGRIGNGVTGEVYRVVHRPTAHIMAAKVSMCMCMCVVLYMCVCMCLCAHVCACVCVCARVCICVRLYAM